MYINRQTREGTNVPGFWRAEAQAGILSLRANASDRDGMSVGM